MGGRCQVAKATYRDVLARRARENALDFVEGVATALTPIAFFETFMVKSYETLVDSDTRVDVNTMWGRICGQAATWCSTSGTDSTAPGPMCMSSAPGVCSLTAPASAGLSPVHGFQQWAVRIT